ncbi:MAG: Zn-dependent alcohol dehydrogenase [Acidimicrobiales bacterium]
MKAAVLHQVGGPLVIEDVELDDPWPNEVVVRTFGCGVCHSDLHFIDGHYSVDFPVVLGHEASGVVESVGSDVSYVQPGDHVIACMSVFCGECNYCSSDRPYLCMNPSVRRNENDTSRIRFNGERITQLYELGAFAEKMLVHESALVKIRKDMPLDQAALIGCAVTTGFGAVMNTANVSSGATVAVVGCGGVGLSAINGSSIIGASKIIAIDVSEEKLDLARQIGATHTVNAAVSNPVEAVLEMSNGGVEFSFEALGKKETAEQCFEMLCPGGVATVIGMIPEGQKVEVTGSELLSEKTLQGSNMGSNQFRVDMPYYVDLYLEGKLKLDLIREKNVGLESINESFEALRIGASGRRTIVF